MSILISSAEETFLHVGSLVSMSILIFGFINYKTSGSFVEIISKNKKLQPLFGALLGALPGCGGSIVLMPLFISNKVTFGTIIASLIASMGDSAFLMMTTDFKAYILVTVISFLVGILTGYIVDHFKTEERLELHKCKSDLNKDKANNYSRTSTSNSCDIQKSSKFYHLAHEIVHGIGYKIYLLLLITGCVFMILAHSGLEFGFIEAMHSFEEIIAILGIVSSFIYMIMTKKVIENENFEENEHKLMSLKETLIHSVSEISFVIVWIFLAYVLYDLIILMAGGEEALVKLILGAGVISVFAGAALGIVPGCGVQIVVMSFYLKGSLPFAALVANSISQDGDALFPLLAMDKKSALWATIITTIPSIIVGLLIYFI
ncbi:membrane protein [Paraclostridium benzoelyticum]|uniref:Membrane protein n=1 Tax=Paraclostridium benzoelyticum TaxID=1629550 RepID=A0A0M3DHN4_9FIRM|nr:putative manganese transporter [Paraclostridium benzoelyticum]KKY00902.1 membrane protein [Paraclostridium benzoelyticum]